MDARVNRRQLLKSATAGAGAFLAARPGGASAVRITGKDVEVRIAAVSAHVVRLSIVPLEDGHPVEIAPDDALTAEAIRARPSVVSNAGSIAAGKFRVQVSFDPLAFHLEHSESETARGFTARQRHGRPELRNRNCAVVRPG